MIKIWRLKINLIHLHPLLDKSWLKGLEEIEFRLMERREREEEISRKNYLDFFKERLE